MRNSPLVILCYERTMQSARYVEGLTALLLNLNRRHRASTSVRILGLS
jgi:hypothetical protein